MIAVEPLLKNVRIAVARDEAFAFTYGASLDLLRAMGAELSFSIRDTQLPEADSVIYRWLSELHHVALWQNTAMVAAIRAHHAAGLLPLSAADVVLLIC